MVKPKPVAYAVLYGHDDTTGIFTDWTECSQVVTGVKRANFQGCSSYTEAKSILVNAGLDPRVYEKGQWMSCVEYEIKQGFPKQTVVTDNQTEVNKNQTEEQTLVKEVVVESNTELEPEEYYSVNEESSDEEQDKTINYSQIKPTNTVTDSLTRSEELDSEIKLVKQLIEQKKNEKELMAESVKLTNEESCVVQETSKKAPVTRKKTTAKVSKPTEESDQSNQHTEDRISLLEDCLIKLSIRVTETQSSTNRVIDLVENQLVNKLGNINKHIDTYGTLKSENNQLKSDVIHYKEKIKELQGELKKSSVSADNRKYVEEIEKLKDRIETKDSLIGTLRNEISELNEKLDEIEKLKDRIELKDNLIDTLRNEISELNDELAAWKAKTVNLVETPCVNLTGDENLIFNELGRVNTNSVTPDSCVTDKTTIKFYHDSIAKHVDLNKLIRGFKVDDAKKEVTYTLSDLREKVSSDGRVHTYIIHVGINDITQTASRNEHDLVEEMVEIVQIMETKCQKVIISLIAPAEIESETGQDIALKISSFNRKLQVRLREKDNIILCNNSNLEYRGNVINRLYEKDKKHLSQQGSARLAANIISCLTLEKKDSFDNNNDALRDNGNSFRGRPFNRRGRGRGRGRQTFYRNGDNQQNRQNSRGPGVSNNQLLQALRSAILGNE